MEDTYLNILPLDVKNMVDKYQKEYFKRILQEVLNSPEAKNNLSLNSIINPEIFKKFEKGLHDRIKVEYVKISKEFVLKILESKILTDLEFYKILLYFHYQFQIPISRINGILRQNKIGFRIVSYKEGSEFSSEKCEMEYPR